MKHFILKLAKKLIKEVEDRIDLKLELNKIILGKEKIVKYDTAVNNVYYNFIAYSKDTQSIEFLNCLREQIEDSIEKDLEIDLLEVI